MNKASGDEPSGRSTDGMCMKLSVIIVNYNVRAYLEQCLRTVFEALHGIEGEVFVVDNLSTDGSVEMVREKFPQVRLMANTENVGFSRANNQAIRESRAEYVVLLNPDTVVEEEVFRKVIAFLDAHPKAGGLGVKMIDGTGRFLPESKRGLPTPAVAFYKIIGLTRLFPRSKVFGRYHLGHLRENEAAPIEILSGACMFLRKRTLDKVGLLDESFFMYGEDIDLSYRITLGGYENWYLPEARIIHYKGESTKKSSVNYVFVFYNAMAIFAKKHFTRRRTDSFSLLINGSIYLSAAGAIVVRFLRRALPLMLDGLSLFALRGLAGALLPGMAAAGGGANVLLHALVMLGCFGLVGAYDLPLRLVKVVKGALLAWAVLLVGGLLDLGPLWSAPSVALLWAGAMLAGGVGVRLLLHAVGIKPFGLRTLDRKRVLSVGSREESRHALALLWQTHFGLGRQMQLDAAEAEGAGAGERIRTTVRRNGIDEVVFCAKDLRWGRIIALMEELRHTRATFKIAQPAREFIIGPSTIESLQDLMILDEHAVSSAGARRRKRLMDIGLALIFLVTLPIGIWFVRDRGGFVRNLFRVLRGERSWIGYFPALDPSLRLPRLRPGVLDPVRSDHLQPMPLVVQRMNLEYAKDYRVLEDLRRVLGNFSRLGG